MNELRQIIRHYGDVPQLVKSIEESAEFIQAMTKYLGDAKERDHVIDEMADLFVMLKQVAIILHIPKEHIQERMDFKIKRTLDRIKDE